MTDEQITDVVAESDYDGADSADRAFCYRHTLYE